MGKVITDPWLAKAYLLFPPGRTYGLEQTRLKVAKALEDQHNNTLSNVAPSIKAREKELDEERKFAEEKKLEFEDIRYKLSQQTAQLDKRIASHEADKIKLSNLVHAFEEYLEWHKKIGDDRDPQDLFKAVEIAYEEYIK